MWTSVSPCLCSACDGVNDEPSESADPPRVRDEARDECCDISHDIPSTRSLHSSSFQLNLSRF